MYQTVSKGAKIFCLYNISYRTYFFLQLLDALISDAKDFDFINFYKLLYNEYYDCFLTHIYNYDLQYTTYYDAEPQQYVVPGFSCVVGA